MALVRGRDARFDELFSTTYGGGQHFANLMLYHMLRVAGWQWRWECDGEVGPNSSNPNHVEDGNMEAALVAKYTAASGGLFVKTTAEKYEGQSQSLMVTSDGSGESGVKTVALLNMTNPTAMTLGVAPDDLSGPAADGSMTILENGGTAGSMGFIGCRAVCSGFTDPANNGTFPVRDPYYSAAPTANYCKIQNPSGVAQAGLAGAAVSMERKYDVVVYAKNSSGVAWKVCVDPGDGVFDVLGTIPSTGAWGTNHFEFYATSTNARYVQIMDDSGGVHAIYIGGISVFRSIYEWAPENVYETGTGEVNNTDRFNTDGSGHVMGAADVGKWVFLWDSNPANPTNSGWYKIIADIGGGVVQLAMRSTSAVFTASTGLNWRMVDVDSQCMNGSGMPNSHLSCGFGIESPHASKWRYFTRMSAPSGNQCKGSMVWSAPEDTDFDISDGHFFYTGPSTQRNKAVPYAYATVVATPGQQSWQGMGATGVAAHREWLLTDEDGSFFMLVHWGVTSAEHGVVLCGYMGADAEHPGIEEFACFAAWEAIPVGNNMLLFDSQYYRFGGYGIGFSPEGRAVPCSIGSLGYSAAGAYCPTNQSNGGDNPWSGNEWLMPLLIIRDPDGVFGCYSERDSDIGIYRGRENLTNLDTFDSDLKMHFDTGLVIDWNGVDTL